MLVESALWSWLRQKMTQASWQVELWAHPEVVRIDPPQHSKASGVLRCQGVGKNSLKKSLHSTCCVFILDFMGRGVVWYNIGWFSTTWYSILQNSRMQCSSTSAHSTGWPSMAQVAVWWVSFSTEGAVEHSIAQCSRVTAWCRIVSAVVR